MSEELRTLAEDRALTQQTLPEDEFVIGNPAMGKQASKIIPLLFLVASLGLLTAVFGHSNLMHPHCDTFLARISILTKILLPVFFLIAMVAVFSDRRVVLNSKSLKLNGRWKFLLSGRLQRTWDDVQRINLISSSKSVRVDQIGWKGLPTGQDNYSTINFFFKSGGYCSFYLDGMTAQDGLKLIEAIDRWAPGEALTKEISELCQSAHEQKQSPLTLAWNDQLRQATAFMTLPSGSTLQEGRLIIEAESAASGFSAVYLARDNNRQVILKEIALPDLRNGSNDFKGRELFHREAQLLTKVRHKRIPRLLDHFTENNRDYIELELFQGKNLRRTVAEDGTFSEASVLKPALELAQIIDFLHSLEPPIIHRDITPDNVILQDDGSVALIDFGAANEYVGTVTGTMIGKQAYMPPEQLRGRAVLQSDIYAFGATIFYLLTGRDPLPLSSSAPAQANPRLSAQFDSLVRRCTAIEPDDRPQNMHEVIDELQAKVN